MRAAAPVSSRQSQANARHDMLSSLPAANRAAPTRKTALNFDVLKLRTVLDIHVGLLATPVCSRNASAGKCPTIPDRTDIENPQADEPHKLRLGSAVFRVPPTPWQ